MAHSPIALEGSAVASLRAAVAMLLDGAFDLRSVSLTVALPEVDGAARPILYSAERLAATNDLELDVRLGHGTAEVTLRRRAIA